MKEDIIKTLESRKTIADNSEKIIKYGQKFQKNKSINQLSLFDAELIDIEKVTLEKVNLSDAELSDMSNEEEKLIGFPLLYDEFSEYMLIEKTLCTSDIRTLSSESTDGYYTILAKVDDIITKTSKAGNNYYILKLSRSGIKYDAILFGKEAKDNIRNIFKGHVHLIRLNVSGSTSSVRVARRCIDVNPDDYIVSIIIDVDSLTKIESLRSILHFKAKSDNGFNVKVKYKDDFVEWDSFKCKIDNEIYDEIVKCKCKVFIERR